MSQGNRGGRGDGRMKCVWPAGPADLEWRPKNKLREAFVGLEATMYISINLQSILPY